MTSPSHMVQKKGGGESRHAQHVDVPSPIIPLFRHVSDVCRYRATCLAISLAFLVTAASCSHSLTALRRSVILIADCLRLGMTCDFRTIFWTWFGARLDRSH